MWKEVQMKYRYSVNEKYFSKINSHEKAYILGFIVADGGVYGNNLSIGQSGKNGKMLLEWIKEKLSSNNIFYVKKPKKNTHNINYVLTISSNEIVNDLSKFNVSENKKYCFEFPQALNLKYFKSFLRGYFDGDGCVGIYDEKTVTQKGKTNYSEYLKLSFYGTKNFITYCNNLLPNKIKGRIAVSKSNTHAEIIWTNKKAREFGLWLFENNNEIYPYVKISKFRSYMDKYKVTPKLHERLSKPVIQKNLEGKIIGEYPSLSYVKRALKISIGNCLTGLTKQAGGYLWEYK
jgi:hypothetical protein